MVLGKKVAIFELEWGRISAPRDGQKRPCNLMHLKESKVHNGNNRYFYLLKSYC